MNRSTAKAATTARDTNTDDALTLLAFDTTSDGVRVCDLFRERLESAEARIAEHAAGADDAILRGEAAQQAHEAEAARLEREATRLRLAIDRADARLTDVAARERRAAAEAEVAVATAELTAGREDLAAIRAMSEALAGKLEEYAERCARIEAANAAAVAAGLDCVLLPHYAESESDRTIEREVYVENRGPRITDATGREMRGFDSRGNVLHAVAASEPSGFRRVETQYVRGRKARDPRRAGFVLPDVLNDSLYVLRQD